MLAEIAANPTSLPLWAVFLFAAAMYPLGLLLPGCPCCGTSGCTQCGYFSYGYADPQNQYGRMCCTGTIATSVTLRVTNTGPASGFVAWRGPPNSSGVYTRISRTFPCSSMAGDYVFSLSRSANSVTASCQWSASGGSVFPTSGAAFPDWILNASYTFGAQSITTKTQQCSGYPGIESCNIGTSSSASGSALLAASPYVADGYPYGISSSSQTSQRCNPAGFVLANPATVAWYTGTSSLLNDETGCGLQVEFV